MNNILDTIPDGIEKCEDLCNCGGQLRLHVHRFKQENEVISFIPKCYVECPKCGKTSGWHQTIDDAIEEFDTGLKNREVVQLFTN